MASLSASRMSAIVGDRQDERGIAGRAERHASRHQPTGVDQHARRGAFVQPVALQVARALADRRPECGGAPVAMPASCATISVSTVARRIVEIDRAEALFGRFLQVLQHALVAGVVGDHELEVADARGPARPSSPAAGCGGRRSADGSRRSCPGAPRRSRRDSRSRRSAPHGSAARRARRCRRRRADSGRRGRRRSCPRGRRR